MEGQTYKPKPCRAQEPGRSFTTCFCLRRLLFLRRLDAAIVPASLVTQTQDRRPAQSCPAAASAPPSNSNNKHKARFLSHNAQAGARSSPIFGLALGPRTRLK